ncbi:MAG: hypothetical protein V1835_00125 [Candidatus Micrarchaeota archaeon]
MLNFRRLKSQVDSPIELVIAIIILLASLSIAMLIFGNTGEQQCRVTVKGEIQKLQLAMQDLALQSPPSTRKISFTLPRCGGKSIDLLRFVYFSQPDLCRDCPGHFSGCWKLQLTHQDVQSGLYDIMEEICVDVAGDMSLDKATIGPEGEACSQLATTPCREGEECTAELTGYPKSVFDPSSEESRRNSPSRWESLETTSQKYEITLKKGIGTCGAAGLTQCPVIYVCAVAK